MQRTLLLVLLGASSLAAQTESHNFFFSEAVPAGAMQTITSSPVQGAPYSATISNELIQTLADGNRIVQTSSGTTVRDSQGRTRQDTPLPMIANMSPANAPHIVFIQDPVAGTAFTLNLTDKTAMKGPSMMQGNLGAAGVGGGFAMRIKGAGGQVMGGLYQPQTVTIARSIITEDSNKQQTEDLGTQTMEGVLVKGTRTTSTIPAGQIGNDKPISIVTEVWSSPELKTIVYSKRSDPRMGDQTFKLTNIVRAEPDPTLFTIPADFKIDDEPQPIMYRTSGVPAQ